MEREREREFPYLKHHTLTSNEIKLTPSDTFSNKFIMTSRQLSTIHWMF
jgi:hypothetical protein